MPPKTRRSTVSFRYAEGQERTLLDVHEFVALAASSRWVVISDDRKSSKVFVCCPALQPTMLQGGEHVRLIRTTGCMKLKVDEMSKYEFLKAGFLQEEAAYVSMLSLIKSQKKGKKKMEEGSGADNADALKESLGAEIADADPVAKMVLAENVDVDPVAENVLAEIADADPVAKMVLAENVDADPVAENVLAENVDVDPVAENVLAENVDEGTSADPVVADIFVADEKIIVQGKPKSGLELLVDMWKLQKKYDGEMTHMQQDLKAVHQDLKAVHQDLKAVKAVHQDLKAVHQDLKGVHKELQAVQKDVKAVHKSLSQVAERGCRSNLALLYADIVGKDVKLIQPIVTRWYPYDDENMEQQGLESLALLYKRKEKVQKSGLVEVDMLLKVLAQGSEVHSPQYVESSRVSAEASGRAFTHIIIGEYSRGTGLCAGASDYSHPAKPCRDASAKLLYKLIQVERAAIAATRYYAVGYDFVDAAAIMSPSFNRLVDPQALVSTVLFHVKGELPIVENLFTRGRMWLVDL